MYRCKKYESAGNKYDSAGHKHKSACNKYDSAGHKRKSACKKYESVDINITLHVRQHRTIRDPFNLLYVNCKCTVWLK